MKKFFNKIVLFISTLFTSVDAWIHEHVQPSIETVERLKALVDSPFANIITALIPGDGDDKMKNMISFYLGKAIDGLNITADIINEPDWAVKANKLIQYLKTLSPQMRNAVYFKLASELSKQSAETETFKGHGVDLLVQMQYSKLKEGVTAEDLPSETIIDGEVQNGGDQ